MKINIITLFPELIRGYLSDALLSKAITQNKFEIKITSLRDSAEGNYKSVDEVPFGGGDGMVIRAAVLEKAIGESANKKIIYLSPQGKPWTHQAALELAKSSDEIILICGRYAGIDQRFIEKYVDEEISIGDYVLSGGELAALVVVESVSRFIPGVLGDRQSVVEDSFAAGLLEAPQFTRPQNWNEMHVPEVLTSGNHQKISEWKKMCGYLVTLKKRPDLLTNMQIDSKKIKEFYNQLSAADKKTLGIEGLSV
ncbi:MAG: tRNA (guanosine(37)-N1)-methyltransferase TrmD [Bdellovibrio sp.]|nr:tRNA (guanosine(37)-N1)-methyltransferase TrmD [Bdellovibrio sp.]